MIKKTSSIILTSAILSACGGGGGGGNNPSPTPAPPPDPIEVNTQTISVPENTTGIVTINSDYGDLLFEITDQSTSEAASVVLEVGSLQVNANEVDRPGQITGVLYSESKGIDHFSSKDISVAIVNSSAQAVEVQANNLVDQSSKVLGLQEDKAVLQFILESAYLSSLITYGEKTTIINGFNAESAGSYTSTASEIENLSDAIGNYQQGDISDTDLSSALDTANVAVENHGSYASQELADISTYSDAFFGDLTLTDMEYDPVSGRYSRYLGQASMGDYSDGSWFFDRGYSLMSSLITRTPSDPILLCEAN